MVIAEVADIRKGVEFHHLDEMKRQEEEEARVLNSEPKDKVGLASRIENPLILERCVPGGPSRMVATLPRVLGPIKLARQKNRRSLGGGRRAR